MNKLLVITGGTKGIGRAIVNKFAKNGYDIVTCSRSEENLLDLKASILSNFKGVTLHTFKADLAIKDEVKNFGNYVLSLDRNIDILINNTGVYAPGQIHNEADGILEKMINTNLYSAYYFTRSVLPRMMESKSGSIFTICSTASIIPYVNGGSYCISKFALLGMNKVLREELKPFNIKVTSVLPGATKTESWNGVDLPEERFCKAEDIADAVFSAYTLSPNAVVEEILIRPQLGDI